MVEFLEKICAEQVYHKREEDFKLAINERIKQLRLEKKLSQKQFADLLGVTQSGVSYMEQTGNNVSSNIIKSICAIFDVSENWLETEEGKMLAQPKYDISFSDICDRIKELRKELLKLTQAEFGERLGVSRSVINNIERNVLARPDQKLSLYKLICSEFNVREEWLLNGTGEVFMQAEYVLSFPDICKRMKELRKAHLKLTAEAFGKRLGVNRDIINNIENNRLTHPDQKLPLYKLVCFEFGVNEKWLLHGIEPIFSDAPANDISSELSFGSPESGNDFFLDIISEALKIYNNFNSKEQETICVFMKTLIEHFTK